MKQQPDRIVLFTQGFPYENGEVFLRKEVEFLSQAFEKVLIIPYWAKGNAIPLPPNVSVKMLPDIWEISPELKKIAFKKHWIGILKMFFGEWVSQCFNPKVWKLARENFALVKYFFALQECMDPIVEELDPDRTVFYSYWCSDRATVVGALRQAGKINIAISRIHGFDLYADQNSYIRFRSFQTRAMDFILPISENGTNYLKRHFPDVSSKFQTFKLGVADCGVNPFDISKTFTIVSCSALASHKRVKCMATVIARLPYPVRWIHFGNGAEFDQVEQIASNALPQVKIELRGNVPNAEILNFYQINPVHLFLNYSCLEGIPFSIMEAISFGIPVLGVNIGGVSEIVSDSTGILLPANATESDLIEAIGKFRDFKRFGQVFREGVKKFWAENFEEERNFKEFINYLKQL